MNICENCEKRKPFDFKKSVKTIIDYYGKEPQHRQLAEECAELAKEALKGIRCNYSNRDALIEELADVEIMIWQMKIAHNITPQEVGMVMMDKLKRQIRRIEGETNG